MLVPWTPDAGERALPELNTERLSSLVAAFIDPSRLRLGGVEVSAEGHRLGGFVLPTDGPRFTGPGGQGGPLTRESWFRRQLFALPPHATPALAAVLHVADAGADGEADERLVGWVLATEEEALAAWLAGLNGELVELLEAERDHTPERAEFHEPGGGPQLAVSEAPLPRSTGVRLGLRVVRSGTVEPAE